jgi:hypothetical protein
MYSEVLTGGDSWVGPSHRCDDFRVHIMSVLGVSVFTEFIRFRLLYK